ncbi:MAG: dialkylresorcinol condensing enzyme DarA [Flavobacteriaceae bacterium]|nr:dialkylresorcinol condensing enzyme DarA [Flavobacteriaceae bacterium]
MKQVLVLYYSQSGQLREILSNIASPLKGEEVSITYCPLAPKNKYNFPWSKKNFFGVFPETFLQIPQPIEEIDASILQKKYDLILLGYTVWYLSPSLPISSFLQSEEAKSLLKNTPVITIIGCRNMWFQAQEKIKKLLTNNQARLVGNIALVDRHPNHISVITIAHWMFSGKKTRYLGIFPKPGISTKDIQESIKFGFPIKEALLRDSYVGLQKELLQIGAVTINPFLVLTDKRGNLLFSKWAHMITKKPASREKWLRAFNYYLLFAIWIIAPLVFIVFLLTYPVMVKRINKEKKYLSSVSLKND